MDILKIYNVYVKYTLTGRTDILTYKETATSGRTNGYSVQTQLYKLRLKTDFSLAVLKNGLIERHSFVASCSTSDMASMMRFLLDLIVTKVDSQAIYRSN